jgi:hypothetical protein
MTDVILGIKVGDIGNAKGHPADVIRRLRILPI